MTAPFTLTTLSRNRVIDVNALWRSIDFAPLYQRQSDIWSVPKRQLFIDSLINGFDIPKLYFHDLSWDPASPTDRFAIIDGKQRLEAIHNFASDKFGLSDEFEDLLSVNNASAAAGLKYSELDARYPVLKRRFDDAVLPIVIVHTTDFELIDEMFSRLNEAVPLNAPEKRNAFGGPLPDHIRRLVTNPLFTTQMAFPNSRYRHLDIATKFLYIEYRGDLVDLKKRDLDAFVREFKTGDRRTEAAALATRTEENLLHMSSIFMPADPLLASVGMIIVYYQLAREAASQKWLHELTRDRLDNFDDERTRNRSLVKEAQERALEGKALPKQVRIDPVLTQFERYVQSPNDAKALKYRYRVVRHFVRSGQLPAH
jgi:hypothetical protein